MPPTKLFKAFRDMVRRCGGNPAEWIFINAGEFRNYRLRTTAWLSINNGYCNPAYMCMLTRYFENGITDPTYHSRNFSSFKRDPPDSIKKILLEGYI